ncbi:hypothetical protein [Calidifontibacter terrae]
MTASPPTVEPPADGPSQTKLPPIPGGLKTPPNAQLPGVTCPTGDVVLYPQNGVTCGQAKAIYRQWQSSNGSTEPARWSASDGTQCVAYESAINAGQCTRAGKLLFQLSRVK